MKVLLVGGSGLIGSVLAASLCGRSHDVMVVDKREFLIEGMLNSFHGKHVRENIYNYGDAERHIAGFKPQVVVFLASNPATQEAAQFSAALTLEPLAALHATYLAADTHGVKRFVLITGAGDMYPSNDTLDLYWTLAETFVHYQQMSSKMETTVLKPTKVYAPGTTDKRGNLLNTLLRAATDGSRVAINFDDKTDFVYISDVVLAITGAVEQGTRALPRELRHDASDSVYYISSGSPTMTVRQVIELFNEQARLMSFPTVAADNVGDPDRFLGKDMAYEENDTSSLILLSGVNEAPTPLDLGIRKLIAFEQL